MPPRGGGRTFARGRRRRPSPREDPFPFVIKGRNRGRPDKQATKLGLEASLPPRADRVALFVAVLLIMVFAFGQLRTPWRAVPRIIALCVTGCSAGGSAGGAILRLA